VYVLVFCCWQRPARYSIYDGTKVEDHFLYAQEGKFVVTEL